MASKALITNADNNERGFGRFHQLLFPTIGSVCVATDPNYTGLKKANLTSLCRHSLTVCSDNAVSLKT